MSESRAEMANGDRRPALPAGWYAAAPAGEEEIARLRGATPIVLPQHYLDFLRMSNGGEGEIRGRYVSLWQAEEVMSLNEAYGILRYLPGALAIGTDGGDYAYIFDGRREELMPPVLEVELGSLGLAFNATKLVATSIEELLDMIWPDDTR